MLDRLLALVDEHVAPDRAPAVRAFTREYVRRLTEEQPDAAAEGLFREALGAFELASERGTAPLAVRAFNPDPAEHGYQAGGAVLETNTEDLPFLVDSVSGELEGRGLGIVRVVHPIVGTERDAGGRIVAVKHPREASATESVMHFELDRPLAPDELAGLEDAVRTAIEDVRGVVRDHGAMRKHVEDMIVLARAGEGRYDEEEVTETVAFLRWLLDGNFVFLGARDYEIDNDRIHVTPGSGLGLLSDTGHSAWARPVALESLDASLRERIVEGDLLIVSKSNRLSPVHRRARMDYVGVRRIGPDGATRGESRMLGLFTSKAYVEPASQTPLLHRKLRSILASEDLIEGSHDYKAAIALFDSFPKDELLAAPVADLRRAVVALLGNVAPDRVRVLGRVHPDGRGASLIVDLPKSRYDASVLARLRELVGRRVGSRTVDAHEVLGEGDRVQIHLTAHTPEGGLEALSLPALQREIGDVTRTWDDRAREALVARHGERGRVLAARWASACRSPSRRRSTRRRGGGHRLLRAPVHLRQPVPRRAAQRGRPDADRPLPRRRQARALARDADARAPRPAGDRGAPDAPRRRRRGRRGCRTSASSARPTARSTSTRPASGSPTASRRSGGARRSPTRSTAS